MKNKKILNFLKNIIDWLSHYHLKFSRSNSISTPYNSLSPTDNAENIDYYIESLNWALLNREKIKNIAISGPYGSGKSSVIQTFQKRNKNKDFRFLNISLATFKEINDDASNPTSEELLRLVELSILQQFFYHEKDNKIPDSRFKKIKSHSKPFLRFLTLGIIIFLISFLYLIFPDFLAKFSLITVKSEYQNLVHLITVFFFIIGLLFILYKATTIIKSIAIKKLSINNASIEIDDNISKSILNNHLDEILYFFEVTKYNTVIIEDIDRFEQTEVFTKLRELNLLINNSKKIKENIVFVYAIRDDMFKDNQRTKFFDFMIPIIPVINSSNSNEKLLKIIKENSYNISNDLVGSISLFISDMRLLFNIMNEYHIYSNSLDKNLKQDKLLSMIVYKNMHPIDFTDLSNNKGTLYQTLSKKEFYIKEKNKKIDTKISSINDEIKNFENNKIKNIKELRIIYLSKLIEKINKSGQSFHSFRKDNITYNLEKATEDEFFKYFLDANNMRYQYTSNSGYLTNISYNFSNIESEVNNKLSYRERELLTISSEKLNNLKKQIEDLEDKKNQIKKHKIKDLFLDNKIEIKNEENKQNELINILLRNGYIGEDYLDYISIFYEGSLSKKDYQFLINVKTQKNTELSFKLDKVDNLIKKINQLEFEKVHILNYSLLDYLLSSNKHKLKSNSIFTQLKNESKETVNFIDGFIERTSKIEEFIKNLSGKWNNIWHYVEVKSNFSEEKKKKYFKLIIEHANIKDIKEILNNYKSIISDDSEFLSVIKNKNKLKDIIKILDIKFTDINTTSPKELLEFIYSNNHFEINTKMVKNVIKFYKKFNEKNFYEKNYTSIQQSEIKSLIKYIDNNIDEYITFVYLDLKTEIDNIEPLENLLNNEDIFHKESIVKQSKTKVENIDEIKKITVKNILLKESKMSANWNNIYSIYDVDEKKEFSKELVDFINKTDNAKALSKNKIDKNYPNKDSAEEFIRKLILEDKISEECYEYIIKSIPFIYSSLDFEGLSFDKINLLIENKVLITNNENFKLLKENFEDLHISLIEINTERFFEDIENFELNNYDRLLILKSEKITINEKVELIQFPTVTTFTTDIELLKQIGFLLIKNLELKIPKEIINSVVIKSQLKDLERIKIFNKYNSMFDNNEIEIFINSLGKPYSTISEKGKRPLIEFIDSNEFFLKILVQKKYISKYEVEKKGIRISTFRN